MSLQTDIRKIARSIPGDAIATTAAIHGALMLASLVERGTPWAAINPTCHMIDGDDQLYGDNFDKRDTLLGAALIASAMMSWAVIYRLFVRTVTLPKSLLTGTALALVAYVTDYYLVPKRFTPGFEQKLSGKAIFFAYCMLALAFASRPPLDAD